MDFNTGFNTVPIIAGVSFGCFFLIILLCIVCRLCAAKKRSQSQFHPTVVGPTTVSNINSQFNQPLPAAAPCHTFASTPYAPSVPAENYPLDPWHHYPTDPSRPIHHQPNIYSGQLSSATSPPMPQSDELRIATSPPMPQSDAPPSYSEVTASY